MNTYQERFNSIRDAELSLFRDLEQELSTVKSWHEASVKELAAARKEIDRLKSDLARTEDLLSKVKPEATRKETAHALEIVREAAEKAGALSPPGTISHQAFRTFAEAIKKGT